jgi:hypothetical protein
MSDIVREDFMRLNGVEFDVVSQEDKNRRTEQLCGLAGVSDASFIKTSFYK